MPISVRLPPRVEQQLAEYSTRARVTKSRAVKRALERLFAEDPRPVVGAATGPGAAQGPVKETPSITVNEARAHLAQLIDEVAKGREVLIARRGRAVARLVPVAADRARKPGYLKGRIRIAPDFDAPLPPEVLESFEGRR
jgi:prevent-host-death family protein